METHTIKLHRVLRCAPERVYRAFLDADAYSKWLPPNGFTGKVHEMDATVGGTFKMSFTNFGTGQSHSFGGTYLELTPHERIRYSDVFDDPNLPGEMQVTISMKAVSRRHRVRDCAGRSAWRYPARGLLSWLAGIPHVVGETRRNGHPGRVGATMPNKTPILTPDPFGEKNSPMPPERAFERHFGIFAAVALVLYLFALCSEAAYHAGGIGFMEKLTWPRMLDAYQATTSSDLLRLEMLPMGAVAVAGMLAAIGVAFVPGLRPPTWSVGFYLLTLLLSGGWIGLLGVIFLPTQLGSLDGEFLDEMLARATATGFWTALVLGLFCCRIIQPALPVVGASPETLISK